jgi:uncharacterized protein (TIGR03067 family)
MVRSSALLVGLLVSAAAAQNPAGEAAKLQGAWVVTELHKDGEAVPKDVLANTQLIIQGDRYIVIKPAGTQEGTLKVDGKTLDLAKKGKDEPPVLGIFEVTGDTLRIAAKQGKRPTELKPGDGFFYVLKRAESHPVSGTVTLDGKPLAKAIVTFHGLVTATGETDDDGKYRLTTQKPADGAPAGL